MAVIRAKSVKEATSSSISPIELLARFCYLFPQYKLKEARSLPYKDVIALLKEAEKENARKMVLLAQVIAAPHDKKRNRINEIIRKLQECING